MPTTTKTALYAAFGFALLAGAANAQGLPPGVFAGEHDYRQALAGHYALDPDHTAVVAKVSHIGYSFSVFRFDKTSAALTWDPAAPDKDGDTQVWVGKTNIGRSASPTRVREYASAAYQQRGGSTQAGASASAASIASGGGGGRLRALFSASSVSSSNKLPLPALQPPPLPPQQQALPQALLQPPLQPDGASAPLASSRAFGFLPVPGLITKDVRSVSCGNGFTVATVATEWQQNEQVLRCTRCSLAFFF